MDVYLKGRGLPSFYVVKMPDLTFVLGLSGWSGQSWTDSGSFDLLNDTGAVADDLVSAVHEVLRKTVHARPKQMAVTLNQSAEAVWRACERICRQGRAIFDVESRGFRHRELFEQPIDESTFFPPDERFEQAKVLLAKNAIPFVRCEPSETRKTRRFRNPATGEIMGREVIYRDWRVTGTVGNEKTEIAVGDTGRIIFGTCSCAFFRENLMGKGPCGHMIALFKASAEERKDLPTSTPSTESAMSGPTKPREEENEEDFDGNELDEKNEGR